MTLKIPGTVFIELLRSSPDVALRVAVILAQLASDRYTLISDPTDSGAAGRSRVRAERAALGHRQTVEGHQAWSGGTLQTASRARAAAAVRVCTSRERRPPAALTCRSEAP
jgi:hypothetical protein